MEATSARMASRYQFDGFPVPQSNLQRFIYNSCDPVSNLEPNLALNMEIVDMINSKKGNAPREAAVIIVQIINHRNPNVALLALGLLDNCVKNCGYPFHLQISTKEFLNELVRRFPERPPLRPSRVQSRILEAIEEWRATICQTSRYKDDLGFIRDMHRLLLYKGYMFPEVRRDDAAVLNSSDTLKSAEEMEEEERAAQSAKLQELIRRGGPQDLQEANRLMKIMAGYDTRNKTDYRAKAAEEVSKVQQKARILEEMLQSVQEGDKIEEGDVFEELAIALQSAHPKIQKMCEEESEDSEAVAKLLDINDSIHRTVERYKLIKDGKVSAANNIPKGTLGTTTGVGRNAANELSLIDFDPEPTVASASQERSITTTTTNGSLLEDSLAPTGSSKQTAVEDDLLGLSLGGPSNSSPGGIALSGASPMDFFGSGSGSASSAQPVAQGSGSFRPPQPGQSFQPNYDAFASLSSNLPPSKPQTPVPFSPSSMSSSQKTLQQTASSNVDPFAALASSASNSRPSTPSLQQKTARNVPNTHQPSGLVSAAPATTAGEDEWDFVSSLPAAEPALPPKSSILVHSSVVKVEFEAQRRPQVQGQQPNAPIHLLITFSNQTTGSITGLHFQVAVEKSYSLQLRPQSGKELPCLVNRAVSQEALVSGVPTGKGDAVKMRFKVSYVLDGVRKEEQGMVPNLGIA